MNRDYPGIRMHLGYYGPQVSEEPIAQMTPRLAGCEVEGEKRSEEVTASSMRTSRVEIRVELDA